MIETTLRTRTHGFGYAAALVSFLVVAWLNLHYGFYELFFRALILALVMAMGLGYTLLMRRQQLKAHGHQYLLAAAGLVTVLAASRFQPMALLWLFPLALLILLVLPLRRGLILCGALVVLVCLFFAGRWSYPLLATLTGLLLLIHAAALFAYRYHYNARSVETLTLLDGETGAWNLRCFRDTLGREISRSKETAHPLSLVYLEVDYYRELLDLHGAVNLQPVLRRISDTLRQVMRAGDSHYYAGDGGFYLLLPYTPEEGVRVIVERLRREIALARWPVVDSLTVCLGCTTRASGEEDAEALEQRSRQALEAAQSSGRNRAWYLQHDRPQQAATGVKDA
ncbi:MAG: GGDEF domain-containing protein [Oleiphilaceae bacterium]|nr:GGDEF domain-containing protein [Oleiphilaceae bacterium]